MPPPPARSRLNAPRPNPPVFRTLTPVLSPCTWPLPLGAAPPLVSLWRPTPACPLPVQPTYQPQPTIALPLPCTAYPACLPAALKHSPAATPCLSESHSLPCNPKRVKCTSAMSSVAGWLLVRGVGRAAGARPRGTPFVARRGGEGAGARAGWVRGVGRWRARAVWERVGGAKDWGWWRWVAALQHTRTHDGHAPKAPTQVHTSRGPAQAPKRSDGPREGLWGKPGDPPLAGLQYLWWAGAAGCFPPLALQPADDDSTQGQTCGGLPCQPAPLTGTSCVHQLLRLRAAWVEHGLAAHLLVPAGGRMHCSRVHGSHRSPACWTPTHIQQMDGKLITRGGCTASQVQGRATPPVVCLACGSRCQAWHAGVFHHLISPPPCDSLRPAMALQTA